MPGRCWRVEPDFECLELLESRDDLLESLELLDSPLCIFAFFGDFGAGYGLDHDTAGKITLVLTILSSNQPNSRLPPFLSFPISSLTTKTSSQSVRLAVTLYSNRFFHPGSTLLFPNLALLKSSPFMLRQVLLLQQMKNWGVRLLDVEALSWERAMVKRILDIVPPLGIEQKQLNSTQVGNYGRKFEA
jgi:hypothetical protein